MRIYWKNVWYNYTKRLRYLLVYYLKGYYKSKFHCFYYPGKLCQTEKEFQQYKKEMNKLLIQLCKTYVIGCKSCYKNI